MNYFKVFSLLLVLLLSLNSGAQEKLPLVTDRPDMTESALSVGPNMMQFESGFHFEKEQVNDVSYFYRNLNTSLLRYGLIEGLEFRVGFGYSSFSQPGSTDEGFEPLSFGFKYELFSQSGVMPEMAVLNTLVPDFSGSSEFSPDSWQGEILGAMAWEIGMVNLGANLGIGFDGGSPGAAFPYASALGFPIGNSLGGFVEIFGLLAEGSGPAHSGNLGLTWLLSPDLQLDGYYGFGLNHRAIDQSIGFGLSWRFEI